MEFAEFKRVFLLTLSENGNHQLISDEVIKNYSDHPAFAHSPVMAAINYNSQPSKTTV